MAQLSGLSISLQVDNILRAQGVDPVAARERSPKLVAIASKALQTGLPLIDPRVAYRSLPVHGIAHNRISLEGAAPLTGGLLSEHLAGAHEVVILLGTIGPALETHASAVYPGNGPLGLALDALGTAAVDALIKAACTHFNSLARQRGLSATIPLSPGMEGWDIAAGQKQLFSVLAPSEAGITITAGGMMKPQKSLTALIGLGDEPATGARSCDYCTVRATCRYQDQYA